MKKFLGWTIALVVAASVGAWAVSPASSDAQTETLEQRVEELETRIAELDGFKTGPGYDGLKTLQASVSGSDGKAATLRMYPSISDIVISEWFVKTGGNTTAISLVSVPNGNGFIGVSEPVQLANKGTDPSNPQEGSMWYRGDLDQIRVFVGGQVRVVDTSAP